MMFMLLRNNIPVQACRGCRAFIGDEHSENCKMVQAPPVELREVIREYNEQPQPKVGYSKGIEWRDWYNTYGIEGQLGFVNNEVRYAVWCWDHHSAEGRWRAGLGFVETENKKGNGFDCNNDYGRSFYREQAYKVVDERYARLCESRESPPIVEKPGLLEGWHPWLGHSSVDGEIYFIMGKATYALWKERYEGAKWRAGGIMRKPVHDDNEYNCDGHFGSFSSKDAARAKVNSEISHRR